MLGYLAESGYHQARILRAQIPVDRALRDPKIPETTRQKLKLTQKVRAFARDRLGLKTGGNYRTYVDLDRPYVSWIVRAAPVDALESHKWWFPIVGSVPYLGFFSKKQAVEKAAEFDPNRFDTLVRGATAYSTLGWLKDPVLSTMLRYEDHELVNLILHESVHATLFIASNADFNEQLATFIGDRGAEAFYREREGAKSAMVIKIKRLAADRALFSRFLSQELPRLESWYEQQKSEFSLQRRSAYFTQLQDRFRKNWLPRMQTDEFAFFARAPLNNARLLSLKTYLMDLRVMDALLAAMAGNLRQFIESAKTLEDAKDPAEGLKQLLAQQRSVS